MKRRAEATRVFGRMASLLRSGRHAALATVVQVEGSAYRRPGARMLIAEDAPPLGSVSPGCLEEDVRLHALETIASGAIRRISYDTSSGDALGLGLGCEGIIHLLIRPFSPGEASQVEALAMVLQGDSRVGIALDLDTGAIAAAGEQGERVAGLGPAPPLSAARAALHGLTADGLFSEVLEPTPRVLICGAGEDAIPLAGLAASTGFRVTVADHRPAAVAPGTFPTGVVLVRTGPEAAPLEELAPPGTYAVVKTHVFERDRNWLARLLQTEAVYIGLMGPRGRIARLLASTTADPRIHGPTGLDLGAAGAEQIAVSIVAELLAIRSGRDAGPLRNRAAAIHADA